MYAASKRLACPCPNPFRLRIRERRPRGQRRNGRSAGRKGAPSPWIASCRGRDSQWRTEWRRDNEGRGAERSHRLPCSRYDTGSEGEDRPPRTKNRTLASRNKESSTFESAFRILRCFFPFPLDAACKQIYVTSEIACWWKSFRSVTVLTIVTFLSPFGLLVEMFTDHQSVVGTPLPVRKQVKQIWVCCRCEEMFDNRDLVEGFRVRFHQRSTVDPRCDFWLR
ncbi:uncharacterized protein EV422DRAFT_125856 [Fimicolochytrium jonesii]|uniref:uncharacterized protein n=1 Tax=Fimicolochytrium jonesii TaxID=1396493 RepID=UPI0022FF0FAC|nr:uncharacterized protein EV422DRAFT_125856 [Fimicolochytrium jonesii]KAI8818939.1 hypothetical protein EV422DRAFT_125856 [Fimicolochytrium jonesii]